ncbi:D-amino-acid transaminase [Shinella curvata]|uniref:Probable branched-chain-amino-acid aminotransferase n=1 Tax=Shinella curvata TaxID=1817964 RepID=A0ABT8X956_9HYPH|nr:D-amino-acid transaminase [Shinella curvata]MCJ8051786.1 D-amino-acid transaminase [Shinella curvata]MDO6120266.1 D-amino-acid transaminase [Shinella curvata]
MPRFAYVNDRYVRHADAAVSIEDRGLVFADAVYEVCQVQKGLVIDLTRHLDRLDRSLAEIYIRAPMTRAALTGIMREVLRRNRVVNGMVYLQVSRGVARRDHVFPSPEVRASLIVTAKSLNPAVNAAKYATGIKAVTVADNRWGRVDIKTVGLLPNVLARQQAKEAGAQEAIFVDSEGNVTEGGATNLWIVDKAGTLVTRPADHAILRGVTRTTLMDVAEKLGLSVDERRFSVAEMLEAREVFVTGATTICLPVVSIDGQTIANGHPGMMAQKIRDAFFAVAEKTVI